MAGLLLAGCGATDPVQPDQDVTLPKGVGIAAVVINSRDPLTGVTFRSRDYPDAAPLQVGGVDRGITLRVFLLPAGSYCAAAFGYRDVLLKERGSDHEVCFDVIPGKVAYSGDIGPRGDDQNRILMFQRYNWPAFEKMFKEQYPKLAPYPIVTP
jgi:hypothetical protein